MLGALVERPRVLRADNGVAGARRAGVPINGGTGPRVDEKRDRGVDSMTGVQGCRSSTEENLRDTRSFGENEVVRRDAGSTLDEKRWC